MFDDRFTHITSDDEASVRAVQALLESDVATWTQLEGAPPRPDEALRLLEELPPSVPRTGKHVWIARARPPREGERPAPDGRIDRDAILRERIDAVVEVVEGHPDATTWYLGLIFVAPHARNAGLGAAAVQALCTHVRACGGSALRLAVVTTNTGARRLYDRLGFAHLARRTRTTWTGDTQECDVLELQL
ncbi:MAG: GNAT family N-acetyltransferase [Kofleriaceae bacterium]